MGFFIEGPPGRLISTKKLRESCGVFCPEIEENDHVGPDSEKKVWSEHEVFHGRLALPGGDQQQGVLSRAGVGSGGGGGGGGGGG